QEIEAAISSEDISSRDAGTVHKVRMVVAALGWPTDISQEARALLDTLAALDEALIKADLAAAKEAAEEVHSTQHDLSVATYDWLGNQKTTGSDVSAVLGAIDLIDTAGFHGMSGAHGAATSHEEISTRDGGTIKHVLAAADAVMWPSDIQAEAQVFLHDMAEHDAAMDAADLTRCQAAAEAIHHTQHDLSQAVYGWLASH
ncbi:MAG: hypothetical protein V3S37_07320, partial [Dehalococcoidia bacterium]